MIVAVGQVAASLQVWTKWTLLVLNGKDSCLMSLVLLADLDKFELNIMLPNN